MVELSYVLGQIPSNMIIGYLRPSVYLCSMAIVWSGVSVAMCGTTDFTGLVLVRFFLGVVEAPLLPGAVYLMGCWYTRKEMAMRVATLYTGQTLAYCASGLIAAAVFGTLDGVSTSSYPGLKLALLLKDYRPTDSKAGNGSSLFWPSAVQASPSSPSSCCPTIRTLKAAAPCGL